MDAKVHPGIPGGQMFLDHRHDRRDLGGQGAAVGVAEAEAVGAARDGPIQGGQGIVAVGLEAVEEMFGIVEKMLHVRTQKAQRLLDDQQIVGQLDAEGVADMDVPGLAEDGDGRGLRRHQGLQVRVLVGRVGEKPGGAEGGDLGVLERVLPDFLEVFRVLGVGARPAALDKIDAQLVKLDGNA